MEILSIAALVAILSNTTTTPPRLDCHAIVIDRPQIQGAIGALESLSHEQMDDAMIRLGWNYQKEAPLWAYKSPTGHLASVEDELEGQKVRSSAAVDLYGEMVVGVSTSKPTSRLTSWVTNDGNASFSFPFLREQRLHIQKCNFY